MQYVTLNDNRGIAPSATMRTAKGPRATYYAIVAYATSHNVPMWAVGYSVLVRQ